MNIKAVNSFSNKSIGFNGTNNNSDIKQVSKEKKNGKALLFGTLSVLAASGAAVALHAKLNPKVLTLDKFKKLGYKFENGIPIKKNGKIYTGKIYHRNQNGTSTIWDCEDLDGSIASLDVTRMHGDEILSKRKYTFYDHKKAPFNLEDCNNGFLVHDLINNTSKFSKFTSLDNIAMLTVKNKNITINSLNKTVSVSENNVISHYHNNGTKYILEHKILPDKTELFYQPDGKTKKFLLDMNEKIISVFDKSGNVTKQYKANTNSYEDTAKFTEYLGEALNISKKYLFKF